ncbi:hypothetical protein [Flagellimonas meridianipacifica]|uniref:DUF7738 domain-containing protein n=1 Tax=Flagellimonas meridianipacifica TaxID=1080225 RepID=A0A2T0MGE8_9FLAO|nr:hypothetical protein [Allomuricauda pacifica]PRX56657.1 hypothetical protein CLV81_0654 [Allomuricauda pacifica]
MKLVFTALLFCLSSIICFGQETIEVVYNQDYSVTLNGISIDHSTTYQNLVEILGEPEVYKVYPTGKVNYRYTDLGLVFHTVDGNLLTLAFNFNWDGDKNFPNTSFEGVLKIGDNTINAKTTESIVDDLERFEIKCLMAGMCMNNPRKIKNPILLGFKNDLITQVSIEFH